MSINMKQGINFMGQRKITATVSIVLIVISLVSLATRGLNFGIDFTGGTLIEIRTSEPADLAKMRTQLGGLDLGAVSIQEFGGVDEVLIRIPEQTGGEDAQKEALAEI